MQEFELYKPIKDMLEEKGFVVKGEVNNIDVFAMKSEYSIAVELKVGISLKLLYQAIERQKICDKVYIGLPYVAISSNKSNFKSFSNLLKRLDIGLIIVKNNHAEVVIETFGFDFMKSRQMNQRKKEKTIKEFQLRENQVNQGGIKGKKITRYKELVIEVADALSKLSEASPKQLKDYTKIDQVNQILEKNYYQWFVRIRHGIYQLTELGNKELAEIKNRLSQEVNQK